MKSVDCYSKMSYLRFVFPNINCHRLSSSIDPWCIIRHLLRTREMSLLGKFAKITARENIDLYSMQASLLPIGLWVKLQSPGLVRVCSRYKTLLILYSNVLTSWQGGIILQTNQFSSPNTLRLLPVIALSQTKTICPRLKIFPQKCQIIPHHLSSIPENNIYNGSFL